MFWFTDWLPDEDERSFYGWIFVILLGVNSLVNIILALNTSMRIWYLRFKRWTILQWILLKRRHARNRKRIAAGLKNRMASMAQKNIQ